MNESGLYLPPQAKPTGTTISGIDFAGLEVAPVQARVQLPRWGEKAGIRAPYLPLEKMRLLVNCLSNLPDVDASELTYQISCLVPGNRSYSFSFDLAVVMAILSSYIQRDVPRVQDTMVKSTSTETFDLLRMTLRRKSGRIFNESFTRRRRTGMRRTILFNPHMIFSTGRPRR